MVCSKAIAFVAAQTILTLSKTIGGEACPSQKDASVIITALTAAPRIKRHVENHKVRDKHQHNNEIHFRHPLSGSGCQHPMAERLVSISLLYIVNQNGLSHLMFKWKTT